MKASRTFVLAWWLAVAAVAGADAQTGPYPNKPVQIITDSSAGSTPDVALRIVTDGLTQGWKQQVLVNNHPGAGGSLAVRDSAGALTDAVAYGTATNGLGEGAAASAPPTTASPGSSDIRLP